MERTLASRPAILSLVRARRRLRCVRRASFAECSHALQSSTDASSPAASRYAIYDEVSRALRLLRSCAEQPGGALSGAFASVLRPLARARHRRSGLKGVPTWDRDSWYVARCLWPARASPGRVLGATPNSQTLEGAQRAPPHPRRRAHRYLCDGLRRKRAAQRLWRVQTRGS